MMPLQTGFEVTRTCNYSCDHCFSAAGTSLQRELTLHQIQRILDNIYDCGILFVNLTGGEPVLRKDITAILQYIQSLGEAQIFHFQTNGTAWSTSFLEEFLHICANHQGIDVQISLDGYDPMSYLKARGGPPENFHRITNLIRVLKEHNIEVNVLMTITKTTLPFAMKTADFVLEMGVNQFLMIPLFPTGRALSYFSSIEFSRESWKTFLAGITMCKRDGAWGENTRRVEVGFFTLYDFVIPLEEAGLEKEIQTVWRFKEEDFLTQSKRPTICEAGYADLHINAYGKVFPCTPLNDGPLVAGDALTESLATIWEESFHLNWFRGDSRKVCEIEPCKSCRHSRVCGGGCRASALGLTGDRYALDPRCPIVAQHKRG